MAHFSWTRSASSNRAWQVKLLRVLDGASYYRLGGVRKVSVDVRVIAANQPASGSALRDGRFRGDLYHPLVLRSPSACHLCASVLTYPAARRTLFRQQTRPPRSLLAPWRRFWNMLGPETSRAAQCHHPGAVLAPGLDIRRSDLSPEVQQRVWKGRGHCGIAELQPVRAWRSA